jgi:hypothetical protein
MKQKQNKQQTNEQLWCAKLNSDVICKAQLWSSKLNSDVQSSTQEKQWRMHRTTDRQTDRQTHSTSRMQAFQKIAHARDWPEVMDGWCVTKEGSSKETKTNHAFNSFSFFEAFSVLLRITCLTDGTQVTVQSTIKHRQAGSTRSPHMLALWKCVNLWISALDLLLRSLLQTCA